MAVTLQVEATCDALVGKLNANLATTLAAIEAEAGDGVGLGAPALVAFGPRSELPYPAVVVIPFTTTNDTDLAGGIIYEHRIRVVSWLEDPSEELLMRRLIRYARAVRDVAMLHRRPGSAEGAPGGYGLQHERDEYGPFAGSDTGVGYVAWVSSIFRVQQEQYLS